MYIWYEYVRIHMYIWYEYVRIHMYIWYEYVRIHMYIWYEYVHIHMYIWYEYAASERNPKQHTRTSSVLKFLIVVASCTAACVWENVRTCTICLFEVYIYTYINVYMTWNMHVYMTWHLPIVTSRLKNKTIMKYVDLTPKAVHKLPIPLSDNLSERGIGSLCTALGVRSTYFIIDLFLRREVTTYIWHETCMYIWYGRVASITPYSHILFYFAHMQVSFPYM